MFAKHVIFIVFLIFAILAFVFATTSPISEDDEIITIRGRPKSTRKFSQPPINFTSRPIHSATPRATRTNQQFQAFQPNKKIHIGTVAVCFFGLVKNIKPNQVEKYVEHVYRQLWANGYSTVTLMHTFSMDTYVNSRTGEDASASMKIDQNSSIDLLKRSVILDTKIGGVNDEYRNSGLFENDEEHYQFKIQISNPADADAHFGNLDQYLKNGDPWPDNPVVSLKSYLRQQYSLLKLADLLEQEENNAGKRSKTGRSQRFVGAIFIRPDMLFYDNIDVALFQHTTLKPSRIALPTWFLYWNTGFNDRMAFGSVEAMLVYGRRGNHLAEYSKAKKPHAEGYLRDYLCSRNFEVHFTRTRFARVRLHGVHGPDSPGGLLWLINMNEKSYKDPGHANRKIEYRGCPRHVWKAFGNAV